MTQWQRDDPVGCKYAHGSVECVSWRIPNYCLYEVTSCTCAHLFSMPHLLIIDLYISVPQTLYWTSFDFRYTNLLSHPIGRIIVFLNSLCYWVGVRFTFKELLYCSSLTVLLQCPTLTWNIQYLHVIGLAAPLKDTVIINKPGCAYKLYLLWIFCVPFSTLTAFSKNIEVHICVENSDSPDNICLHVSSFLSADILPTLGLQSELSC